MVMLSDGSKISNGRERQPFMFSKMSEKTPCNRIYLNFMEFWLHLLVSGWGGGSQR